MNKFLILFFAFCSTLAAQETPKEPVKVEVTEPIKDTVETKVYWDEEAKTKIKFISNYYLKNGKEVFHGITKSFHPNGQILVERSFKDGVLDGTEIHYSEIGEKEKRLIFKDGYLINKAVYFTNGTIKEEAEIKTIETKAPNLKLGTSKEFVLNGAQKFYYINGKISRQINWLEGKKNGLETFWYKSGQRRQELTWKLGKKDGIESCWFENGKQESITNWVENQANGEMLNYHENGLKKDQLEWDKDILINERTSWNDQGVVIAKCEYKNGEPFKGTLFDNSRLLILTFADGRQVSSKLCDKQGNLKEK